jgi:hypothetical protein
MLLLVELAAVILVLLEARFILRPGKELTETQWTSELVSQGSSNSPHGEGGG